MSDPFSVAGSAVGVISLGLTVCQGLLTYYGQYKSFHQETNDATSHLETLDCMLKVLVNTITKGELQTASLTAEPARIAIETIKRCERKILELDETLKKCKDTPVSASSSLKFSKARALYPFRRDTLVALRGSVHWLQGNLENSLSLLNLALMMTDHVQITSIASTSMSTHQIVDSLIQRVNQMDSTVHLLSSQVTVQPAVLQSLLEKTERLENDMRSLAIQQPLRLRQLSDEITGWPDSSSCHNWRYLQQMPQRPSRTTRKVQVGEAEHTSLGIYKRLSTWRGLFDMAVQLSLKITVGLGGSSILKNPRFNPTVAADSPAFALIKLARPKIKCGELKIESIHQDLLELFCSGRASPLDTLPQGETLLHVVTMLSWDLRDDLPSWRRLVQSLIDFGVAPDAHTDYGLTPGEIIFYQVVNHFDDSATNSASQIWNHELITTCLDYMDSGGILRLGRIMPIQRDYMSYYSKSVELSCLKIIAKVMNLADFYDISDFDIPEQMDPLFFRSQNKLERLLKRGVHYDCYDIASYVAWPEGLKTLLQAGYLADRVTFRAALKSGAAAVQVLRDTDNLYDDSLLENSPDLSECGDPAAREIVVQSLAEKRKHLLELAEAHLPRATLSRLGVRPDTLLGYKAAEVNRLLNQSLKDDGFPSGGVLWTGWLVYEAACLNTDLADQLWDAGFRDVDDMDRQGVTALMKLKATLTRDRLSTPLELLKMASWLVGKGADPHRCPVRYDYSALHFLSTTLGYAIDETTDPLSQAPASIEAMVNMILLDKFRDPCSCHCSDGGCTPLTVFLDALLRREYDVYCIDEIYIDILEDVFASLISKSARAFEEKVIPEVLCLLTFRVLEISHTCSHPIFSRNGLRFHSFDPAEARETHDEEKDLIRELERLVLKFISDYKRMSLPFQRFMREHWCVQMNEILSKRPTPNEEENNRIREIGVVLEPYLK